LVLDNFKTAFGSVWNGVQTTDTSDPRHISTSAELSVRHVGTGTEVPGHVWVPTSAPTC